jgi:hypothetical protein
MFDHASVNLLPAGGYLAVLLPRIKQYQQLGPDPFSRRARARARPRLRNSPETTAMRYSVARATDRETVTWPAA